MKKLLVLVLVLLLLTITVVPVSAQPVGPEPPYGAPGWSHVCPGQGGSDNPGPGPGDSP